MSVALPTALHSTASPVPLEICMIVERWAVTSLMEILVMSVGADSWAVGEEEEGEEEEEEGED